MASPIGHAMSGVAILALAGGGRPLTAGAVAGTGLLACLPDVDLLPGLALGNAGRWHHGPMHSLGFVLLVTACALAWAVVRRGVPSPRVAPAALAGGVTALHLCVDLLTEDPSIPVGLQLLWPVSDRWMIFPWTPLARVERAPPSPAVLLLWLETAAREMLFFGLPLAAIVARRGRRRRDRNG